MKKTFLPLVILLVAVFAGLFFWKSYQQNPSASICADEVRGFQDSISSSLAAAAKDLQEVGVKVEAGSARKYIDQLSQLTPSDLLALKSCDTQCKLLEQCISRSSAASPAEACPTEYADYKSRVDAATRLMESLNQYQQAAKSAAEKAQRLSTTQQQLTEAQSGVGASGGREELLKQQVAAQQAELSSSVSDAEQLAKAVLDHAQQ